MDQHTQLEQIKQYVKTLFHNDATGHDYFHMQRVADMAKQLALQEKANTFICEAAGWIHDIGDHKLFTNPQQAHTELNEFLSAIGVSTEVQQQIQQASKDVSFSQGRIPTTLEGEIVQEDRKSTRLNSSHVAISYAVFCLKK